MKRRCAISVLVGLAASVLLLVSMLIPSGGADPKGVCDFVEETPAPAALLFGFDPDSSISCRIDFALAGFYIAVAAIPFSVACFVFSWMALRPRGRRIPNAVPRCPARPRRPGAMLFRRRTGG